MPSPTDRNLTARPTKTVKPTRRRQTRHFTQLDQVTQLVAARDTDPDLGFMARLLALCSLPRTNPKNRHEFKRVNGPYTLDQDRTKRRFLQEWVTAINAHGGFGRWVHDVSTHPGDIQAILARHSGVAAIDAPEPPREP